MDERDLERLTQRAAEIAERARAHGADAADAIVSQSRDLSVKVRLGDVEQVEEATSLSAGIRVMVGDRPGSATTNELTSIGLAVLVEDAIELAKLSEPDPFNRPADASELATSFPELELFDPTVGEIDADAATQLAQRAEGAARDHDPRITNSEGAICGRSMGGFAFVTSRGFQRGEASSMVSVSVQPLADDEGGKKRTDAYWDSRRHREALMSPEAIGQEAARRTLRQLGTRKIPSESLPVVFDPDAGRALLAALFGCLTGSAIYRRSSYLVDRLGTSVASSVVEVVDDPLLPRLAGSRTFDGDGLPCRRNVVIQAGELQTYLCDLYSARKLDRQSTASAGRSLSRPSVTSSNFLMLPGSTPAKEIIASTRRGLYVTSMMGFGFNPVTGDFSRGAQGQWIEDGELQYPVGEITVGANFDELFGRIDAVGDDLDPKSRIACPTFRVAEMTISGT